MKKITFLLLSFLLTLSLFSFAAPLASAKTINEELQEMVERGVIMGFGNNELRPNQEVTRGQFATFLYRALKLPKGEQTFVDVPATAALAEGINATAKAGLIAGYGGKQFKPEQPITREQMALIINRALDYLSVENKSANLSFTDTMKLSPNSQNAIANMVGHKIILGYPATNEFKPSLNATRGHAAAFISRMLTVIETPAPNPPPTSEPTPDPPKNPEPPKEPVESVLKAYIVATVDAEGKRTVINSYNTFAEASSALANAANMVIVHQDQIIKMTEGVVVAKAPPVPTSATPATKLYTDGNKLYGATAYASEMQYISSDEENIHVNVAGRELYVKHSEAYLIPKVAMKGQSYYRVNNAGELWHHLYNHINGKAEAYFYGIPSNQMQVGIKYYSNDGVNFYNENGTKIDTAYQYFNMLPYRTKTNYTAEELDAYITRVLQEKEAPSGIYKDATTKSKLIGIGTLLKQAEEQYNLNALMMLAHAIHESQYGMSQKAQNNNNIFGLSVFDSNPGAGLSHENIALNIEALANNYLNKNYMEIGSEYANSSHLGNKYRGVNVRYATDPDWGKKIAGHMLNFDRTMGGKDFLNNANAYTLYEVTSEVGLNIRSESSSQAQQLYRFSPSHLKFVVASISSEQKSDFVWHKIVSDNRNYDFGYVAQGPSDAPYITPLNIAK